MRSIAVEHTITLYSNMQTLTPSQSLNGPPRYDPDDYPDEYPVIGFFGIRDAVDLPPSLLLHAAQFILKGDFFGVHQASPPPLYHRVLRSLPCRPCSLPPLMLTCVYRRSIARVPRMPMRAEHFLEVPKVGLPRGVTSGQRQRRSGARRWCTVEKGL